MFHLLSIYFRPDIQTAALTKIFVVIPEAKFMDRGVTQLIQKNDGHRASLVAQVRHRILLK